MSAILPGTIEDIAGDLCALAEEHYSDAAAFMISDTGFSVVDTETGSVWIVTLSMGEIVPREEAEA